MSADFMRPLRADVFRHSLLGLLLAAILLGAWVAWLFGAGVVLIEVTDVARLEVDRAVHPVEALVSGRVVATQLAMGQEVRAGDVLVELDSDSQRFQLQEEQARLSVLAPQQTALRAEIAAELQALKQSGEAARVGLEEAQAQFDEAEAAAKFADVEAERLARLHAGGLLAEVDLLRAKSDAQRRRATASSLRLAANRLEREQVTKESDRQVRFERLNHEIRRLEGDRTTALAAIQRLENEIERRRIRAPATGPLGET